jgi:outer membrane lipopolysaccharide assembly protein LptE/RlpB
MKKIILVSLVLVLAGCNLTIRDREAPNPVSEAVLQMRRAEVIERMDRLRIVIRRTGLVANRAILEAQLDQYQVELDRLNGMLFP